MLILTLLHYSEKHNLSRYQRPGRATYGGKKMKLLVLGGTIFLGRHIVDIALESGYEVTLFNRGQHNADLYPNVEKLRGDRDGDLEALKGRQWDAVIDTCGYVPRVVRDSAELLSDAVEHYTFISSISVYRDLGKPLVAEDYPVATIEDETVEQVTGETYGALKALCEQAAENAMPGRVLNVRSGLIVGPHDPSDRFTYWVCRAAQGGKMLAPVAPEVLIQVIDARDQARWILDMAAARQSGVYNVTGPDYPLTFGELFRTAEQVSGAEPIPVWVDKDFLLAKEVQPWMELPLWMPADSDDAHVAEVDISKAVTSGLTFRPIPETVKDTLEWANTRPADHDWRAGLSPEREQELLAAWNGKNL
jgi:2'-hydroxyisoflavone reductase